MLLFFYRLPPAYFIGSSPIWGLTFYLQAFLIKYCNASAPAYYDSIWFVTRTRHSRSNLLNRIFITRGRRTVYSSSAWLIKETVHPLPSHYNKNKHSLRGFISASGAMLILYQTIRASPLLSRKYFVFFKRISSFPAQGVVCVVAAKRRWRNAGLHESAPKAVRPAGV